MKTRNLMSQLLVLVFATLVVNQMACNNASFEKADETKGQRAPSPDNPDGFVDDFDSGDATHCGNSNKTFCDPGDDGLNPNPPIYYWDNPDCTVERDGNNCYINRCKGTSGKTINGVELWLVVDSSRSFDEERVAVGNAVLESFITSLRKNIPVVIKVIAGHAPSGPFAGVDANDGTFKTVESAAPSVNPDIFYRHGSEPISVTIRPGMSSSQIVQAQNHLMAKLRKSMFESPISYGKNSGVAIQVRPGQRETWARTGPHSGSDELGLRNFIDAMRLAPAPRDDYAWVVLFMSDENDACTPFVSGGSYVYSHADEAQMKSWYCSNITPSLAFAEAVAFAEDRPYMFGALVYTGQASIPYYLSEVHGQASVGRGYTQMVAKGGKRHGLMVDLASGYINGSLDFAAQQLIDGAAGLTKANEGYYADYRLQNESGNVALTQVATRSSGNGQVYNMQVYVDGEVCSYDTDSEHSYVRPHRTGDEVEIRYCTR